MDTINTRDLYKKKCELEDLRDAVTAAADELREVLGDYGFSKDEIEEAINERSLPPVADDHVFTQELLDLEKALQRADENYDSDDREELTELETLETEVGISAFMHGTELISEDDFEEYAEELAKEATGVNGITDHWPFNCIDWKMAAEELQQYYSVASYQGTDYFFQS